MLFHSRRTASFCCAVRCVLEGRTLAISINGQYNGRKTTDHSKKMTKSVSRQKNAQQGPKKFIRNLVSFLHSDFDREKSHHLFLTVSSVKALVNENRTESDWRAASPTQSDSRNWSPIVSQLAHLLRDFEVFFMLFGMPSFLPKHKNSKILLLYEKGSKTEYSLVVTVAFCQECAPSRYTVVGS